MIGYDDDVAVITRGEKKIKEIPKRLVEEAHRMG